MSELPSLPPEIADMIWWNSIRGALGIVLALVVPFAFAAVAILVGSRRR